MKRNINTIQNVDDIGLSENTKKYIIEALANLGQRYSIKGDGISIKIDTLKSLFSEFAEYDAANYIVKIDKSLDETKVEFQLLDKQLQPVENKLFAQNITLGTKISSYSCIVNETDIHDLSNVCIYATNNYFIYSLVENADDATTGNEVFICEKYDKYKNELVSSLRLFKSNNDTYMMLYLYRRSNDLYYLNIYNITNEDSENTYLNSIANLSSDDYTFSPESFLSEIYADATSKGYAWQSYSSSQEIADSDTTKYIYAFHVIYDQNAGSYKIDLDLSKYENDDSLDLGEDEHFSNASIEDEIFDSITSDVDKYIQYQQYNQAYLYKKLKTKHSDDVFKSNNSSTGGSVNNLFKNILTTLFLYSYNGNAIYVPLDYEFEYSYNTNNPWQIYYSAKDICIHDIIVVSDDSSTSTAEKINLVNKYKDSSGILRIVDKTSNVEKSTFYSFYIEPDPSNLTDIYSINVSKHFTMPYINYSGYWVVDDIETSIYAKGKDAGNPNITIVKSDPKTTDTPTILSCGDKGFFDSLSWKTSEATIKLPKHIVRNGNNIIYQQLSINGNDTFECNYFVPDLSNVEPKRLEEYVDKLKYCILLNLTTVDSIVGYDINSTEDFSQTIRNIYGENGVIMTFWTLSYVGNEWIFAPIVKTEDNVDVAVDINYMTNLYNVIGYAISNYVPDDPDNFMFTHLVFDNVNYRTKNIGETIVYDYPVYPVIKTTTVMSDLTKEHFNSFDLKIEFNDTIDASYYFNDPTSTLIGEDKENYSYTSYIKSIAQSDKRWFDRWNANHVISNEEYVYKKIDDDTFAYLEYLPADINNSVPMVDLSDVFIKNNTTLNKANIVSFDTFGNSYYSYIGTSHDTDDKSYLTIGTSTQNINIGTNTLVNEHKPMFNKQNELHIEFDNTRITSYAYIANDLIAEHDIISNGTHWRKFVNGTTYWTTSFRQVGQFETSYAKLCAFGDNIETNIDEFYAGNKEFIAMTVPEQYKKDGDTLTLPFAMYINDMVSIPKLIKTICTQEIVNAMQTHNIVVKSNNDIISYIKSDQVTYIGVRLNSSMQKNVYSLDNAQLNTTINGADIYTSNELQISYYKSGNIYYFTINDIVNNDNMSYIHKLKNLYTITTITQS